MDAIIRCTDLMLPQLTRLDALAVGVVDFAAGSFKTCGHEQLWFDLASVTKVLGNSAVQALSPDLFDDDLRLLLEHRAGLPAWGLLPRTGWKDVVRSYPVKESPVLYSDFSAMRVSLEIQQRSGQSVPDHLKGVWDDQVRFWRDLPSDAECPKTGERAGFDIRGDVHDPNAWNLGEWCGHAGLFGTIGGVCRTLLALEKRTGLIANVAQEMDRTPHRYVWGWDRVENPAQTLAGAGCSKHTFGHLGFTGTSVWIDAERRRGHVILSNATRDGWYLKEGLNEFRRAVGELVWRGKDSG
jgi:CubicO group peptidase (beta-lactamase class C family)